MDFMAGMRIQKMQMELDEALTADMEDVECYGENNESLAAQIMSPVAIEVDMKGAAIADVSGALLLGDLVSGLQRGGHMVKVINVLPECQVNYSMPRRLQAFLLPSFLSLLSLRCPFIQFIRLKFFPVQF